MATNGCTETGSFQPFDRSDNARTNHVPNGVGLSQEVLLRVPATFAHFPLGFALDAGGSVTKLVYRSKLDYTSGQANNGEHTLRLRFVQNGDGSELVRFLKENCDIKMRPHSDSDIDDERPLYFHTGVGMQHFVKKLEEAFQCTIKVMPELDASFNGILRVSPIIPEMKQTIPFSVESTEAALGTVRDFITMITKHQQEGNSPFGETPTPPSHIDVPTFYNNLMTVDPATLADELTAVPITFPCVFVQCGSGTACAILHEDGRHEMGDFNPTAGKTLLALARLVIGIKSFVELVTLASTGDCRKVDLLSGDLKNKSHQDNDWYSMMPNAFHVFTLGKAAEERYDGTYTKADIAAALLYMQCKELTHFGLSIARQRHVTSVVYAGSFVDVPLTQRILQECFLSKTLHNPLLGEVAPTMHILPHCGFLAALGVWHENNKNIAELQ